MEHETNGHLTLAVHAAGPVRTVELMGREYRVVPARLVQSQVLRNNLGRTFLPAELITNEWAEAWNDAPVVLDHPSFRGAFVSAKNPDVLNTRGVGRVFNARAENGQVLGDVFLDPSRSSDVQQFDVVLANVEAGKVGELSSAFAVFMRRTQGTHEGREFDYRIERVGVPDHLAVFADKRGACSVADGCGLGVNHEGDCVVTDEEITAFLTLEGDVEVPPEPAAEPGDHNPQEISMDREQLIAQLVASGRKAEALNGLSDCDLKTLANAEEPAPKGDDSEAWKLTNEYKAERDELKRRYEPLLQVRERERVRKLDECLAVNGRPWSDQELIDMDAEQIDKVHRALCMHPHYASRGFGGGGSGEYTYRRTPILGGRPGESVFDRKERN